MAKTIDWHYHRKNCTSCARAQDFLTEIDATIRETTDARKTRIGRAEALALAREATHVFVAKGKNVLEFNIERDDPTDNDLAAALIGPTGNLRAPTVRRGKKLYVGFNDALYEAHFGK